MQDQKYITTIKLVEYLDKEATSLLISNNVYDIGSYGWQSEDTEDPEYIGHAMWQVNPPIETESEYLFDNVPVRHRPSEKEKLLVVSGNDFEGLMRASRLSIGLCLIHQSIATDNPFADNHYFWLHHSDSVFQLNMASDRIREYFVAAYFDQTAELYKREGRKNGWYVTPFIQARDQCEQKKLGENISCAISPLPDMAETVYSYRESRNSIVHDISTKLGIMYKESVEKQQRTYDLPGRKIPGSSKISYEQMLESGNQAEMDRRKEISKAATNVVAWYQLLAKLSSHVFEAEYWLRNERKNT